MEQRYDAVLGFIRDGFTVTEVAIKFGVSRQSVHAWLKRYEEGGLKALQAADPNTDGPATPHVPPVTLDAHAPPAPPAVRTDYAPLPPDPSLS